ncbi:unnamed protein product [[Actinomadura] parvosata subsp. kistnae]|nr:unnamed protein product [Actinomadura parvosata subsp. kistnae]
MLVGGGLPAGLPAVEGVLVGGWGGGVGEPVVGGGVVARHLPWLGAGRRLLVGWRRLQDGWDGTRVGVRRLVEGMERRWNVSPVGLAEARRWRRGDGRAVGFPAIVLRPGFLATHSWSLARVARSLCRYGRSQGHHESSTSAYAPQRPLSSARCR